MIVDVSRRRQSEENILLLLLWVFSTRIIHFSYAVCIVSMARLECYVCAYTKKQYGDDADQTMSLDNYMRWWHHADRQI